MQQKQQKIISLNSQKHKLTMANRNVTSNHRYERKQLQRRSFPEVKCHLQQWDLKWYVTVIGAAEVHVQCIHTINHVPISGFTGQQNDDTIEMSRHSQCSVVTWRPTH